MASLDPVPRAPHRCGRMKEKMATSLTRKRPGRPKSAAPAPPAGERRTRAEQRAATVKQILDISEDLFAQLGYFGVTIKDVADRMMPNQAAR